MSELIITDRLPYLKPIQTPEEFQALKEAAASDNHFGLLHPTDIILRTGPRLLSGDPVTNGQLEVIGCASLGSVHCCHTWLHSQKVRARETVMLMNLFEQVARARKIVAWVSPVGEDSPMFPLMEHWGYKKLTNMTLWGKTF